MALFPQDKVCLLKDIGHVGDPGEDRAKERGQGHLVLREQGLYQHIMLGVRFRFSHRETYLTTIVPGGKGESRSGSLGCFFREAESLQEP